MRNKQAAIFILIFLLQFFNTVSPGEAISEDSIDKQVIIVIVNRAGYNDFLEMEQVSKIMDKGYLGLMNIRASGSYSEFKSYATIGWGTRAEASSETSIFYNADEENTSVYQRRTGHAAVEDSIITLTLNKLVQQNLKGEYGAVPGILGEALTEAGLKASVLGNSDGDDYQNRAAALITMNQAGLTALGDVSGRMLIEDDDWPFGLRTNYQLLYQEMSRLYQKSSLVVVETGDFSRLEAYKNNLNSEMYERHRKRILTEIDQFVGSVVKEMNDQTLLMILSPYPSGQAIEKGDRLTPVVLFEKNQTEGGLVTSGTTRRLGIIGNVDIAPTILSYLDLPIPAEMAGRVISSVAHQNQLEYISTMGSAVLNTSQQRYRVLYSFAVYEMLATILALFLIIFRKKLSARGRRWGSRLVLATMIGPMGLLVLPIFGEVSLLLTYTLLIGITLLLTLLIDVLAREPLQAILYATGILVLSLSVDLLLGQRLISNSILGYDPIIGARYYGIGNEFAGVLLGSSLVFSGAMIEKFKISKSVIVFFYGFLIILIGFPALGANVGATITSIFAYLFTYLRLKGTKVSLKTLVYIVSAIIAGVFLLAVADILFLSNESHLAGAVKQLYYSGPQVLPQIITRKIAMNIRVMGVTIWSRVLLLALAVVGILFYKPIGILKRLAAAYPSLAIGWTGIVAACIVGFAVNDSGVVLAATAAIFLSASMLYLVLQDIHQLFSESQK
ncbi:hypothetical protein [Alkaliphilus crotonatoxidans]